MDAGEDDGVESGLFGTGQVFVAENAQKADKERWDAIPEHY